MAMNTARWLVVVAAAVAAALVLPGAVAQQPSAPCGDITRPALSCRDVLEWHGGGGARDGVYYLLNATNKPNPVYCDMRNGGAQLVFKVSNGVAGDAGLLWAGGPLNDGDLATVAAGARSSPKHYVSSFVSTAWNAGTATVLNASVRFSTDAAGVVTVMGYAGSAKGTPALSTATTWFTDPRFLMAIGSSYSDMVTAPVAQLRKSGCSGVTGSFVLTASGTGCTTVGSAWFRVDGSAPYYALGARPTQSSGTFAVADTFSVFVKYDRTGTTCLQADDAIARLASGPFATILTSSGALTDRSGHGNTAAITGPLSRQVMWNGQVAPSCTPATDNSATALDVVIGNAGNPSRWGRASTLGTWTASIFFRRHDPPTPGYEINDQTLFSMQYSLGDEVCEVFAVASGQMASVKARVNVTNTTKGVSQWDIVSYTGASYLWHHVALVYDGNSARLYVDGASASADMPGLALVPRDAFLHFGNLYDGNVYDVRFYDRPLAASEVMSLHHFYDVRRITGELLVQWSLVDIVDVSVPDRGTYFFKGTMQGSFLQNGLLTFSSESTALVSADLLPVAGDVQFTVMAWVWRDPTGGGWTSLVESVLGINNNGCGSSWCVPNNVGLAMSFISGVPMLNFGGVQISAVASAVVTAGAWHHVAMTKDMGSVYDFGATPDPLNTAIYVDGVLVALAKGSSTASFRGPPAIQWGPLVVGRGSAVAAVPGAGYSLGFWRGRVADVRVYSVALTMTMVQYIMSNGVQTAWSGRDLSPDNKTLPDSAPGGGVAGVGSGVYLVQNLLRFNDATTFVTSSIALPMVGNFDISLSVWAYFDLGAWSQAPDTWYAIAGFFVPVGTPARHSALRFIVSSFGFPAVDFGGIRFIYTAAMLPQFWHQLAFVKPSGVKSGITVFLDGNLVGFTVADGLGVGQTDVQNQTTIQPQTPFLLSQPAGGQLGVEPWIGYIDTLEIFRVKLSPNMVLARYFGEVEAHRFNNALRLDGATSYVFVTPVWMGGGAGNLSFGVDVYARAPNAKYQTIFDSGEGVGNTRVSLFLEAGSGRMSYLVDNGPAGSTSTITTTDAVPIGAWLSVLVVQNGVTATIYWDYKIVASGITVIPLQTARSLFYLGKSIDMLATNTFNGYIDNFRIWSMSGGPSVFDAALQSTGSNPNLLLEYKFESSDPSASSSADLPLTVFDSSGKYRMGIPRCVSQCMVPGPSRAARCGDGFRRGSELCDDGNVMSGDGCDALCNPEPNFFCESRSSWEADVCTSAVIQFVDSCDQPNGNWNWKSDGLGKFLWDATYARRGAMGMNVWQSDVPTTLLGSSKWLYETYESTAFDIWSNRDGVTPVHDCITAAYQGSCSNYFNQPWGRDWEGGTGLRASYNCGPDSPPTSSCVTQTSNGFATSDFPFMCMAYRIPPATGSNMLMIVDGSWHSVYMTQGSNAAYYYGVGNWGIASTADNAWHYQCINLHQQTQTSMGPGSHQVQSLILYSHGGGPYGGPLWMDVFQISAAGASVNSGASSKASYDLDTFETGAIWASRNGYTPVQDCTTSFQGLCSLYMGTGWGQNFEGGANIRPGMSSSGFSTQVFPYMCMAYRIPPNTYNNMLVYVNNIGWRSLTMTQGETPSSYPRVGTWNPLLNDGIWHYKCIRLDTQLAQSIGSGNWYISSVIWHDGGQSPGISGPFWIDNFEITNTINSAPCQNVPPYLPSYYLKDTFESFSWCARNGIQPVRDCTTAYAGSCSQYHSEPWGQGFETGSCLRSGQAYTFNLIDYPIWCIAYKIPSTTRVNMLVYTPQYSWRSLLMTATGNPTSYPTMGSWNNPAVLIADNTWRYTCIDVYSQSVPYFQNPGVTVQAVILHIDGAFPYYGGPLWIDEFSIGVRPSPDSLCTQLTWGERNLTTSLSTLTHVRYDVRIADVGTGPTVPLMITIAPGNMGFQPFECSSSTTCMTFPWYRRCYNTQQNYGCDDIVNLPTGQWLTEEINILAKLQAKYGASSSLIYPTPPQVMKIQVAANAQLSSTQVWLDDIVAVDHNPMVFKPLVFVSATNLQPISCRAVIKFQPSAPSGTYMVYPDSLGPIQVYCDMTSAYNGFTGGWTYIMQRSSGAIDFYEGWAKYVAGFGTVTSEHWLGLDNIWRLTRRLTPNLRVERRRYTMEVSVQGWSTFMVGSAGTNYILSVSGFSTVEGSGYGDALAYHSGYGFSTYDRDNDVCGANCAVSYHGAWWYGCCHNSNWNGRYNNGPASTYADTDCDYYYGGHYEGLNYIKMMMREPNDLVTSFDNFTVAIAGVNAPTAGVGLTLATFSSSNPSAPPRNLTYQITDTAGITTFLNSVQYGDVVVGSFHRDTTHPGLQPSVLATSTLLASTIGVSVPYIQPGMRWSFIGQKGAVVGQRQSVSAFEGYDNVVLESQFSMDLTSIVIPENSMYPQIVVPLVASALPPVVQVFKGDPAFVFGTDPVSKNVVPTLGALNYDAASTYNIVTQACQGGYDSGWLRMQSQAGSASGKTVNHNVGGVFAFRQLVKVQVQAIGGANDGFVFDGVGTGGRTDDTLAPYSGVVYARNDTTIRVWAPSKNDGNPSGVMTHLGNGWGAENKYQTSLTANVRVTMLREATPDFDSGWLTFNAQAGSSSYKEVAHYMAGIPLQVRVLVQAVDGLNAGFVFEGIGSAPSSDEVGKYGGVVFGYDATNVRIWAPSARSGGQTTGYSTFVQDGWTGNTNAQASVNSKVRVQVWKDPGGGEYFDSQWFPMASGTTNMSFFEIPHPLQTLPSRVQVMVQAQSGVNAGFIFEGMGSALNSGNPGAAKYGGVVFGYDSSRVRLWAPTVDPISLSNNGRILFVGNGWGGEMNTMSLTTALVRVRAFRTVLGICDSSRASVTVNKVLRPPRATDITCNIYSGLPANHVIGQLAGSGRDSSAMLSYSIVAGNSNGTFSVDSSSGKVSIARPQDISYSNRPQYNMAVRVFDGVSSDVAAVTVNVLNTNRPPKLDMGQVVFVLETASPNTLIGSRLNFSDPDVDQTHLFYLMSLVPNTQPPPFKIDLCTGQIRMLDPTGLDFAKNKTYQMRVMVMDDGVPPLNGTGYVTVNLIHANHAPVCVSSSTVYMKERVPVGTLGSARLNFTDRDGDRVSWKVIGGTGSFLVDVVPATGFLRVVRAVLDYQQQQTFDVIVTATDDGSPPLQCVPVIVTLQLIQVPQPPGWSYPPQVLYIDEDVTGSVGPWNRVAGTVQATDYDGPPNNINRYSLVESSSPQLSISSNGVISTKAYIDFELLAPPFYSLYPLVRATNILNMSAVSTMLLNNQTVQLVQVQVVNVNDPPALGVKNWTVTANVALGTVVAPLYGRAGNPVTDEDFGSFVTVTVISPGGTVVPFVVRSYTQSGVQVSDLVTAGAINFNKNPLWQFQLQLTDNGNPAPAISVMYNVNVSVINVPLPPVWQCPRNSSMWSTVSASDAMGGLLLTPKTQQPGGAIMFFGGAAETTVITSAAACQRACQSSRAFDCWAWSWYGPTYYAVAFQKQCYGRTSTQSISPVSALGVDITSGLKTVACEMFTVLASATGNFGLPVWATVENVGDYVTYFIAAGNAAGAVQLNANSGQLSVVPTQSLDYFNYPLLFLTINAQNHVFQNKSLVQPAIVPMLFVINTTHVDVAPVVAPGSANLFTLSPSGTAIGVVHAVDLQKYPVTCTLTSSTGPAGLIKVDAVSCQVYTALLMSVDTGVYATGSVYEVVVKATNSVGLFASTTFTIYVLEGNVPPVFTKSSLTANWPEKSAGVSHTILATTGPSKVLTFSITQTQCGLCYGQSCGSPSPKTLGAGNFVVHASTGNLTLIAGYILDFEVANLCNVTVRATDNVAPVAAFTEATVRINVVDVNDPPVCPAGLNYTVNEDIAIGSVFSPPIVCTDDDFGSFVNFTATGMAATFVVASQVKSMQLKTVAGMDYHKKQTTYRMMVTACDNGLHGVAPICVSIPVWVFLNPIFLPPAIYSSNFMVAGNASAFTGLGLLNGAADAGDLPLVTLSWAFVPDASDPTNSGLCSSSALVIAGAQINVGQIGVDYWRCAQYSLTVSAGDPVHGLTKNAVIVIVVQPVNNLAINSIVHPVGGLRTSGGEVLNITGVHLGPVAGAPFTVTVTATYGVTGVEYTAASCGIAVKNTLIQCVSAPGVGSRQFWIFTLRGNGLVWTVSSAGVAYSSYAPPLIASLTTVKPSNISMLSTRGGEVVTILGSNFGPVGTAVSAVFAVAGGPSLVLRSCSVSAAHTAVSCTTPPGVGMSMVWQVMCGGLTSVWSTVTSSYAPPVITLATTAFPSAMSTMGGESLVLEGTDFGPVFVTVQFSNGTLSVQPAPAVSVTYVNSIGLTYAPPCAVVQNGPGTRLSCATAAGIGFGLNMSVVVGQQASLVFSTTLRYASPVISSVSGMSQADTEGGQQITIAGQNFGPWQFGVQSVTYGHGGVEYVGASCQVVMQTLVTCRSAPGVGKNLAFLMSVGGQVSYLFPSTASYAPPSVAWFEGLGAINAATSGGQVVRIQGRNFGFDGSFLSRVRYTWSLAGHNATFTASSCTIAIPHVELRCSTAPGAGAGLGWVVTVDSQESTAPSTSYAHPSITAVTMESGAPVTAANTDGGETIYLGGADFGPPSSSSLGITRRLQYGVSGVGYEVTNFTVLSHSLARMMTVPGIGSGLLFTLTIAGQASYVVPSAAVTLSYALPRVLSVTPTHGPTDPSAQPVTVTVTGMNFGLLLPNVLVSIWFGNAADDTAVSLPVTSTVPTAVSHVGYVPGVTKHVVTFVLPPGIGASRAVAVVVTDISTGARVLSFPRDDKSYFSYDDPVLTYVDARAYANEDLSNITLPPNVPSVSDLLVVVLQGNNFGVPPRGSAIDRAVWLQPNSDQGSPLGGHSMGLDGIVVFKWSNTIIHAVTPWHYGTVNVQITSLVDAGGGSNRIVQQRSGNFNYADVSPAIQALNGGAMKTWNTQGGEFLTMTALFMGSTVNLDVAFGPGNCTLVYPLNYATSSLQGTPLPKSLVRAVLIVPFIQPVQSVSDTWTITCITPPGQGANLPVLLIRDGKPSPSDAQLVAYTTPSLSIITVLRAGSYERSPISNEPCVPSSVGCARVVGQTDGSSILALSGTNFGVCPVVTVVSTTVDFCQQPLPLGAVRGRVASAVRPGLSAIALDISGHEYLEVAVPPGEGGVGTETFFVAVSAGTQASREPWTIRYAPPTISRVYSAATPGSCACPTCGPGQVPPECASVGTAGGDLIVIVGTNFGVSLSVQDFSGVVVTVVGVGACVVQSRNHTRIVCVAPAGDGVNHAISVGIRGQSATMTPAVTYRPPMITSIAVSDEPVTDGGFNFTIVGTNFGVKADSSCVFMTWPYRPNMQPTVCLTRAGLSNPGSNGAQDDFLGEGELPAWRVRLHTHTRIIVTAPPGGGVRQVQLTVNGQMSGLVDFAYALPVVYSMTPVAGGAAGGDVVTVVGKNFGQPTVPVVTFPRALAGDPLPMSGFRVNFFHSCVSNSITLSGGGRPFSGTESCATSRIVSQSHGKIVFKSLPGVGANKTVTVDVLDGHQAVTSNSLQWSYFPPTLNSIMPNQMMEDLSVSYTNMDVRGSNFGVFDNTWTDEERELSMTIGGIPCQFPYRKTTNQGGNFQDLACQMGGLTVGWKDVNVSVAMQTSLMLDSVLVGCAKEHYGQTGEWCLACPQGAKCLGYQNGVNYEPVSNPGWYKLSSPCSQVYKNPSDLAKRNRTSCPDVVPCMPQDSCTGNNTCKIGYFSKAPMFRCAQCAPRYYRRAGDCVRCPDNAAILIIGFVILGLCITVGGYVLSRKNVHLVFLNISVDYFQVLGMFANSKVAWPPEVKTLLALLSIFNFNLEIVAPECTIPNVGFTDKWFFVMALPIAAAAIFIVMHILQYLQKRVIFGQRTKLHSHAPTLVAMLLNIMYFLYIYVTRTVLDIFNCASTVPPDGHKYLQAVFEECGIPGGIQLRLMPFAIIALLTYVIAYPCSLGLIIWKKRELIMEDQLIRAAGSGEDRVSNPNAYMVRKWLHKMYYFFRPDYYFWVMIILGRKFGIAFTGLMFNRNPAFQMACALLIMFTAYALQVRFRPYMSLGDADKVMEDHEAKSLKGGVHARLKAALQLVAASDRKRATKKVVWGADKSGERRGRQVAAFFLDYNAVEGIFLACAILVNLAGVMFQADADAPSTVAGTVSIEATGTMWGIMFIISFSIAYFFVIVFTELAQAFEFDICAPCAKRQAAKQAAKAARLAAVKGGSVAAGTVKYDADAAAAHPGGGDDGLSIANPMFTKKTETPAPTGAVVPQAVHQASLQTIARLEVELREARAHLDRTRAVGPSIGNAFAKHKRQFAQTTSLDE